MPPPVITLLKNNVPWGPFTRTQIDEGLLHGDFTVKYLAHTTGLKDWLPLGEVLHYVDDLSARTAPPPPRLPPVPESRQVPPIPFAPPEVRTVPKADVPPPPPVIPVPEPAKPMPVAPPLPVGEKIKEPAMAQPVPVPAPPVQPVPDLGANLPKAPFIRRSFAFVVDVLILFIPVGFLFILGALAIEIPGAWNHINHQSRMEKWELLEQHIRLLALVVAIGFGWLYGAGMESSPSQATIGKRWMGLKATDSQGGRMSFLRASGRYAAKYLSALPCFLGFFVSLFSSRGLALHDRLSGTRVLRS